MLSEELSGVCQCPLGLLPHFYPGKEKIMKKFICMCQCPLGLLPHFYPGKEKIMKKFICMCQCPLGLLPHFYFVNYSNHVSTRCVNALSGCYLISTKRSVMKLAKTNFKCQCPLGLLPHFYSTTSKT